MEGIIKSWYMDGYVDDLWCLLQSLVQLAQVKQLNRACMHLLFLKSFNCEC